MFWDQLTSPQIAELDRSIAVVLLMAATEQHGPHLPLATDRMIGEHFCLELNRRFPDDVLILPSMAVGCSEHHLDFAGSLSLQHATLLGQATDTLDSVIRHGFRNLIVLNSHGGNRAVSQVLLETFGFRNRQVNMVVATWWTIAASGLLKLNDTGRGGVGHGGEFETSLMLAIAPDLVHMDEVVPPQNSETYPWAAADMLRGPKAGLYRTMREMTPNGVFGDPRPATAEKGVAITELVTTALSQLVKDLQSD
ncbi:MAG: creatininase family protein [Rhodothermia bacterium]